MSRTCGFGTRRSILILWLILCVGKNLEENGHDLPRHARDKLHKKTEDSYHMSSPCVLREPPQIMFMAFASPSVRHVALLAPVQRIDFASKTPSHTRGSRSSPSTTPARADKKRRFLVFNSKFPTPFFLTCPKPVLADRFGLRKRRRKQRRFLPPAPSSASHAAIAAAVAACCFDAAINPPCRNSASRLKIDYRKTIHLPRQARDKHWKHSKKRRHFRTATCSIAICGQI